MELKMWIDYDKIKIGLDDKREYGGCIVYMTKTDKGIEIRDGSDGYRSNTFSKEEVIVIANEMIKWANAT